MAAADALRESLQQMCAAARRATQALAPLNREQKDAALEAIAVALERQAEPILAANARDVAAGREAGLDAALIDRLVLDPGRLAGIAKSVREIAALPDPVGEVVNMARRPNGLLAGQQRIPLGVIAMIYESRPNVTVDAAALCLKSGNAVLLRGGKEARESNAVLGDIVRAAIAEVGIDADAVQIVPPGDREAMKVLMSLSGMIDLLIPRGGEGLIRFVAENARVPVVQHYQGVCHLYVDEGADLAMARRLVENGKLSRPGVCNALECLLVHEAVAETLVPGLGELAIEVRGDARTCELLPSATRADDWGVEFLAPILACRVVASLDEALAHIRDYGSLHTEVICTRSHDRAQRFLREVDASCVMVNASSRFNDGGMLGLGAEIGISTTKLHAYGPMGLASLTALKWVVQGEGQVR